MMWNQWQVTEGYDWDDKDQSFRKHKKVGEPVWFDVNGPTHTDEMTANHQYWNRTYVETIYAKERPVTK